VARQLILGSALPRTHSGKALFRDIGSDASARLRL